jgi:hypothetical protein
VRLPGLALFAFVGAVVLHGCGGYDPITAPELRIHTVSVDPATPRGFTVNWRTTEPANSRIDYGPAESSVRTFYQSDKNGIGLDCDGHVMSETRTNCNPPPGPIVHTAFDPRLVEVHSLVATESTTDATTYLAITSVNVQGQIATFTVTLPRANPISGPFPGTR